MTTLIDTEESRKKVRDERVKRAILTIFRPYPNGNSKRRSTLLAFKSDSYASTWKYSTYIRGRGQIELFIKANEAGQSPWTFLSEKEEIRGRAARHADLTPTHYGIYTILSPKDIVPGYTSRDFHVKENILRDDTRLLRAGIMRHHEITEDSIVIEISEFIPGLTLDEIFENSRHKKALDETDIFLIQNLCQKFHLVHRDPTCAELGLRDMPDEACKEKRIEIYNESLEKLRERAMTYLPIEKNHSLLSSFDIGRLSNVGFHLRTRFWNKEERLRFTHGDAQARNCKVHSKTKIIYILDWGRISIGDYGIDFGRFICDLYWRYEMDHSSPKTDYYLHVIDYILSYGKELYNDPLFELSTHLGIYSLASIRLSSRELRGIDPERANRFFKRIINLLENKL